MFQGECADLDIKDHCCKSCTASDGTNCVDADAGRCTSPKVRKHCCAMCRETCAFPDCQDISEQQLKRLVGAVEGEGGCPHAAAQGKCEHSALYHKQCCA